VAHGLAAINWQAPWLAHVAPLGQGVAAEVLAGRSLPEALNLARPATGLDLRFVPQAELPAGSAYESYIFNSRKCPTREGLHDFFNGLAWLHFPATKTRLNALQAGQIAAHGVGQVRGAVRDALTVLDENAAFLQAPPALWEALRARQWQRLFLELRPLWGQARLILFGHALLEKLVQPRKAITAHVLPLEGPAQNLAEVDAQVAASLCAQGLAAKPFVPLPVLGVPGWWPANDRPDFYADDRVFRPGPASLERRQ
jgi:Protein of unknown function (DUF3025)